MRVLTASLLVLCCGLPARAAQVVWGNSWSELERAGRLVAGQVQPDGWLKVDSPGDRGGRVHLLAIEQPNLTGKRYGLAGTVRYQNVGRGTCLEMWSVFAGGRRYFTRTLASAGPLAAMEGDSDARPFALPFLLPADASPPERIELSLAFSAGGTVWLGPVQLLEYAAAENPLHVPGAWWDDRTAGWLGGIGGSLIGLLGAAVGILAGLGRCRRLALLLVRMVLVFGLCSLLAGLVALVLGQPYAVYYPLLLGGTIVTVVLGLSGGMLRRRYQQLELRRMAAADLGGNTITRDNRPA